MSLSVSYQFFLHRPKFPYYCRDSNRYLCIFSSKGIKNIKLFLFGTSLVLFLFFFFSFNWRLITLQYCSGFCHTLTCVPHPEPPSHLPPHPIPQGHPSAPALSALSYPSNLDCRSMSHMVICMFQCYSLKSSHPRLFPQSPKVCSLHLCLFCCLGYRGIITIFLNSVYMC